MSHVLISPLNWGLGHATRDIPIIRTLLDHNHDVTIAACGNAPVIQVGTEYYENLTVQKAGELLDQWQAGKKGSHTNPYL